MPPLSRRHFLKWGSAAPGSAAESGPSAAGNTTPDDILNGRHAMSVQAAAILLPFFCLIMAWILSSGCGEGNDIAEDLNPRPAQAFHSDYQEPWSRNNCYSCHPMVKLHLYSPDPFLDLVAIRRSVDIGGLASCPSCHYAD